MKIENIVKDTEKTKEAKEYAEIFEHYIKLERQMQNPDRNGMIDALKNARVTAQSEITNLELQQGDIYYIPWEFFPDRDLYRKLSQYQNGLRNHLISKIGEKAFNELLKNYINRNY